MIFENERYKFDIIYRLDAHKRNSTHLTVRTAGEISRETMTGWIQDFPAKTKIRNIFTSELPSLFHLLTICLAWGAHFCTSSLSRRPITVHWSRHWHTIIGVFFWLADLLFYEVLLSDTLACLLVTCKLHQRLCAGLKWCVHCIQVRAETRGIWMQYIHVLWLNASRHASQWS